MNKEQIIGKEFTLDLGSTPVQVVIKNITKDKVIVEYLNSTHGRIEEFSISDFEYFAMIKIDNNKNLIDEAYNRYRATIIKEFYEDTKELRKWATVEGPGGYTKEQFINKCKTDSEFSERWGLKIEERELSLGERINLASKSISTTDGVNASLLWELSCQGKKESEILEALNNSPRNIPTKLITITYNNETIESYE